ncbi:MAG: hypothetical protein MJY95_00880 [Bacteroidaceae bacterium]|nr:hypothetical protein [Bacteroidaceae bacterium]
MKRNYIVPAITATTIFLEEMIAMSYTDTGSDTNQDALVKERDMWEEDQTMFGAGLSGENNMWN